MRYFLAIVLYILCTSSVLAQSDSTQVADKNQSTSQAERVRPPHVFDFAKLFNPTLIDKFEQKLDTYEILNRIAIRVVTVQNKDLISIDGQKIQYKDSIFVDRNKSKDILILMTPRIDSLKGEAFIITGEESANMLSADTCKMIVDLVDSAWLAEEFYENGAIIAVDSVVEKLDEYIESQKDPLDFVYIGVGLLLLAAILYLFSTMSFKVSKSKKGDNK